MDMCLMLAASYVEPTILQTIGEWAWMILSVGAGLTFVIFVHELGHFLVAKACGVKCEKFYVGFDFLEFKLGPLKIPRALIKFQWGETEYGLGSLPLGGYVKMLGQDDDPRNAEAEAARIKEIKEGTAAEGLVPGQTVEGKTVMLDPRSFPAKSIPARMAIISAGVIMNLIFAVILGAAAYKMGVTEMPAVIGATTPGGTPWKLGIEPGSQVIQIGKSGSPYEYLRWEDFFSTAILNKDRDVPMLVRAPNGEEKWYDIRPTTNPDTKRPMLGVGTPASAQANIYPDFLSQLNPSASPPLEDFDLVVEADGQKITSGEDLKTILVQQTTGVLPIKVERPHADDRKKPRSEWKHAPEVVQSTLQTRAMRDLGLAMKIGPIVAIRDNSPAAAAGLQEGDLIVAVNGESIGDPISLSQRLKPTGSTPAEIEVTVERKVADGKPQQKKFKLTPVLPRQSLTAMGANPISVESIGVAFRVTNEVQAVVAGGPAAGAKLAQGDAISQVEFLPPTSADIKRIKEMAPGIFKSIKFSEGGSWPFVVSRLQEIGPETKVKLTWTRGGKEMSAELASVSADDFNDETRGLELYPKSRVRIAGSFGEAFQLGFRETKDRLTQTLVILQRLVTLQLSPTNLSGPTGIIAAAGMVASQGLPDLLLFLVLLSANLAILNFLPIPALDGGHMVFLTAEAIRGKPVDEKLQMRLTMAGVLCLLSLMVFATAMDIGRFAKMFQQMFD